MDLQCHVTESLIIYYYMLGDHAVWHRMDGPAYIYGDHAEVQYWVHGKLHRVGGAAIVRDDGVMEWYVNGEIHRDDGPAYENPLVGFKIWYNHGMLHRSDGPAVKRINGEEWFFNDQLHRLDGPAVEDSDGEKHWYVEGQKVNCRNNEEFLRMLKLKIFW